MTPPIPTNPSSATVSGGANVDLVADQQHGLRARPAPSPTVMQSSVGGNPGLQAMDDNPGFKALHSNLSGGGGGGMHLSVPPAPVGRYSGGGGGGEGGGGFQSKTTPDDLAARQFMASQRIGNKDGQMAKPSPQENWGLGSNPDMGSTSAWHDLNPDGPAAFGAPNNHPTVTPSPADFNNRIGFVPSRPSAYGPDGLPGMPATPQEAALLPKSAYGSEGLHTSIVGDPQADGLPNPELVESAEPIRVTPLKNMSGHQMLLALARLPHYAEGTPDGGDETDDFDDDSSSFDSVPPPAPVFYDGDAGQGTTDNGQDNPDFHPMVSPRALASVQRSDDDTADTGYETAHPNFHPMVDPRVLAALQAGASGQGSTIDRASNTDTALTVNQGGTAENFRPLGRPFGSDPESVWHQAMAGEGNSRPLGSTPDGDWESFHPDDHALGSSPQSPPFSDPTFSAKQDASPAIPAEGDFVGPPTPEEQGRIKQWNIARQAAKELEQMDRELDAELGPPGGKSSNDTPEYYGGYKPKNELPHSIGPDMLKDWRMPPDAVSYQVKLENGKTATILAPRGCDWQAVYDSGYNNGTVGPLRTAASMQRTVGHFGTFDLQRNAGRGDLTMPVSPSGDSDHEPRPPAQRGVNTFYPAYTAASNFNVGLYLGGAGYNLEEAMEFAKQFAGYMSSNAGAPEQLEMWKAGWQAAQSMKPTNPRIDPRDWENRQMISMAGNGTFFDGPRRPPIFFEQAFPRRILLCNTKRLWLPLLNLLLCGNSRSSF